MLSDEGSVYANASTSCAMNDWNLNLTACCGDAPRAVRFLTGAVMACGGCVISRSLQSGGAAIEFAFPRATCVEMYSVLVSAGIQLSGESHRALAILCQCTRETEPLTAEDVVVLELRIQSAPGGSGLARGCWLLAPRAA